MIQDTVTIVLPTYKEVDSLPSLIDSIEQMRTESIPNLQLIIVDDDSRDGTVECILQLNKNWIELCTRTEEKGLSSAVLYGLSRCKSKYCVVMDADGSHPPSVIPSMITAIEDGADFVVGSRYISGGSTQDGWGVLRWVNSKVATIMARPFTKVKDPMSGFLCFKRDTYLGADTLNPIGYKIGLELIVKCGCKNVVEVPIHFRTRKFGESKLTLKVQWEYFHHVLRLVRYTHPKIVSFCSFATVGLSGTLLYVLLLLLADQVFASKSIAILSAIWLTMTWNFYWDRKLAFWNARSRSIPVQYLGFIAVCAIPVLVNFYLTYTTSESLDKEYGSIQGYSGSLHIAGLIGSVAGSAVGLIFNFIMSRFLVFGKRSS